MLEVFPDAPLFTLVYNREAFDRSPVTARTIYTSQINKIPLSWKYYRNFLPILPLAIEQFDLSGYDLIISSSYAVAHGVLPRPDQLHIGIVYTPLRQAWHHYHEFMLNRGWKGGLTSIIAKSILHYLRIWDQTAAIRVDRFVAISDWVSKLIWRYYRRSSEILYPPVDIDRFQPLSPRGNYYLAVSRLASHKRVLQLCEAFSNLRYPLILVGDGPEKNKINALKADNIQVIGWQSDERIQELMGRARAFVHTAEEDFGMVMVEAQAAGCPVIAFGRGGARETVIPGKTGLLYYEPTPEGLISAVQRFERNHMDFGINDLRESAARFSQERFKDNFYRLVEREWLGYSGVDFKPYLEGGRRGLNPQPSDPQSDALPVELRPPRTRL